MGNSLLEYHFGSENRLRAETAQIDILNDEKLKQKYTQPAGGGAARRPASGPVFNRSRRPPYGRPSSRPRRWGVGVRYAARRCHGRCTYFFFVKCNSTLFSFS